MARTELINEARRVCETDRCTNLAEARDFYCLSCHLAGLAPVLRQGLNDDPAERARVYEIKCLLCGRGVDRKLTRDERVKIRPPCCEVCGGAILIEEAEYGTLGSALGSRLKYG